MNVFEPWIVTYCMSPSASHFFHSSWFFCVFILLVYSLFCCFSRIWVGRISQSIYSLLYFLLKGRFKYLLNILSLQTCKRKDLVLPLVSTGDDRWIWHLTMLYKLGNWVLLLTSIWCYKYFWRQRNTTYSCLGFNWGLSEDLDSYCWRNF